MEKATLITVVVVVALALPLILATPTSGAVTWTLVISSGPSPLVGQVKARASGGAYCNVRYDGNDLYKTFEDSHERHYFGGPPYPIDNIGASLFTDLEAPGAADDAYRSVEVYQGTTLKQSWTTHIGGDNWEQTEATNTFPVGSGGWKFIVTVWGTDWWGSQETCRYKGVFEV
jgi:hypothetical protein